MEQTTAVEAAVEAAVEEGTFRKMDPNIEDLLGIPVDDPLATEDPRSERALIIPVGPPLANQSRTREKRRDKIARSSSFKQYWRENSKDDSARTRTIAHTIALSVDYEENIYNLVVGGVIPSELESDTEIFKWLLARAFNNIQKNEEDY